MTTKQSIIILSVIAAISYGGYFAYQAYRKKKINDSMVSLDEAIKMLEQAKANG